ncbi:hypothetical protein [Oceanobacillus chungangensis]|uniref:Uncharacterized protein n=1 Tax=Oceanobacillus chungangensis TaxID=1229152 RepID=A0A3D8PSP0_9BACI|nr:hypothetical protein [Oceanobacillus chungangensis]RDW18005.1 hypothetical protein CWR45_11800 [Oceanobacillus chungangensis]
MKKVTVSVAEDLGYGTLLWIYANNHKVYHSNKRVDRVESFDDIDSNFLGKVEELDLNKADKKTILNLILEKTDRIFGVCVNKKKNDKNNRTNDYSVVFFQSWEQVKTFAETTFQELAQTEVQRKKEAKEKWLERGRLFSQKKNSNKERVK